jgi:hypothetical protein
LAAADAIEGDNQRGMAVASITMSLDIESLNENASSIAESWARNDLAGAAAWGVALEDEKYQAIAIGRISNEWLEHNTEKA